MQADPRFEREFAEFAHRVDEPVVDGRGPGIDEDRSLIDGVTDGIDIGPIVGPAIHVLHVEVEDLGRLVDGRVPAVGGDDVEPAQVRARLPLHLPRDLHGLEDALRASGGELARGALGRVEEVEAHLDHFFLHGPDAGEGAPTREGVLHRVDGV